MTKVVVKKFANSSKLKAAAVTEKRVRDTDGKFLTVRTLDGHSKTFTTDLTYVFSRNVAKARRENKLVTGTTDRVPDKS